jgi:MFS family permease
MRPHSRVPEGHAAKERTSTLTALREGFYEVRSRQWVWVTLSGFCVAVFLSLAPWFVLGPVIAEDNYGGTEVYGVVAAAMGVGTIAGSLMAIRWRPRHPMRYAAIGALLWPPSNIIFALGAPLPVVLAATVAAGVGVALFEVWWQTSLAERIPPDRLSRVSSYDWTVSLGLLPFGYIAAGPLADAIGATEVMAIGSAIGTVALAAMLLSPDIRNLGWLPSAHPEPPSEKMRPPIPVP